MWVHMYVFLNESVFLYICVCMHVYKCVYVDVMSAGVHVCMHISICMDL